MREEYGRNNHSIYKLHYHLVIIVKYRRNIIDDSRGEFLKSEFKKLGDTF